MSESKHTPGPWEVSDTSIVTEDFCIAVIEDDGGYEVELEQREANARLIAAAPAMLEALEAISEMLNLDDENSYVSDDREGAIETAFSKAKAAIAKAKGTA